MRRTASDFIQLIEDQESLYSSCAESLLRPQPDPSLRTIALASLHGQSGRRLVQEPSTESSLGAAFTRFIEAMQARIQSDEEPWHVRQVVNITTEQRLEQVVDRMLSIEGPHYELRALVDPHSLNVFSPLIISETH